MSGAYAAAMMMNQHIESRMVPSGSAGRHLLYDAGCDPLDHCSMVWVDTSHPERGNLEDFIARVFRQRHHAQLHSFCDVLMGFRDADGTWVAALGFTPLACRQAFLEQYLDMPVEQAALSRMSHQRGRRIALSRWEMVEVGNLASELTGASRALILRMTQYLYRRGFRWVVFTATRCLSNSFDRLAFQPVVLADADPARLEGEGAEWGSYFNERPRVMLGDIGTAFAQVHASHR